MRQYEREEKRQEREQVIADKQNELQLQLASERYQDELLFSYTIQIGALLEKSNGSLTSSSITSVVARAKTLHTE